MSAYINESNSLVLDSSSFQSGINSPIVSPVVNDDIVLDLLSVKEDINAEPSTLQRRSSIRNLFKHFPWSKKKKPSSSKKNKSNDRAEDNLSAISSESTGGNNNEVSVRINDSSNRGGKGQFDNLYDISAPLTQTETNKISVDQENIDNHHDFINNNGVKSKTSNTDKTGSAGFDIDSSMRTLSRTFSVFSVRSRSKHQKKTKNHVIFSTAQAAQILKTYKPIQNDDFDDSENKSETLVFDTIPEHNNEPLKTANHNGDVKNKKETGNDEKIYLFLNNNEESVEQLKNIDKFLTFPYSKTNHTNSNRKWEDKTEQNKSILLSKNFNLDSDNEVSTDGENNRGEKGKLRIKDASLTVDSLNVPGVLAYHKNVDTNQSMEPVEGNMNFKSVLNHQMDLLDIERFERIQCPQTTPKLDFIWKTWVCQPYELNKSKKYKVIDKITDYDTFTKTEKNYEYLFMRELVERNERIYILRDDETPPLQLRNKFKSYGEYVFNIPYGEDHIAVWNTVTDLLIRGVFDKNTAQYTIMGICWRKYLLHLVEGFHLTFYIKDRINFKEENARLLLSDIRLAIPEGQKQYFKKCRTLFPETNKVVELTSL